MQNNITVKISQNFPTFLIHQGILFSFFPFIRTRSKFIYSLSSTDWKQILWCLLSNISHNWGWDLHSSTLSAQRLHKVPNKAVTCDPFIHSISWNHSQSISHSFVIKFWRYIWTLLLWDNPIMQMNKETLDYLQFGNWSMLSSVKEPHTGRVQHKRLPICTSADRASWSQISPMKCSTWLCSFLAYKISQQQHKPTNKPTTTR